MGTTRVVSDFKAGETQTSPINPEAKLPPNGEKSLRKWIDSIQPKLEALLRECCQNVGATFPDEQARGT